MTEAATAQAGTGNDGASAGAGADGGSQNTGAQDGSATLAGGAATNEGAGATAGASGASTEGAAAPDWRAQLAGDDARLRERLNRFASPADLARSYRALEQKFSSGEYRRDLPETATDEEKAAWRKEQGIPDKTDGYAVELPEGLVLGKDDQPVVDLFRQFAHERNYTPRQFNEALTWYYETQDALASQREDADAAHRQQSEDALRAEYGADFRRNMNVLGTVRDSMPEDLAARLLAGRLADGTKIGNDPAFIRWMVSLGLELNPASTLVPATAANAGQSIASELESIARLRVENPEKYWKDNKLLERERELIAAQEKMRTRAA
jgi:hypothetical protein